MLVQKRVHRNIQNGEARYLTSDTCIDKGCKIYEDICYARCVIMINHLKKLH